MFFRYDSKSKKFFPFIVVGFFEKQKKLVIGQSFVFVNKVSESFTDIKTGESIINIPNHRWECVDLTIDENYYTLSLILKNSLGKKTTISHGSVFGKNSKRISYTQKEADSYEKKFGKSKWLKILEGKVAEGFTEEMVLLSWGEPKEINKASYGDQWVYENQYLYFENGKLKSFN